jgi:hypothetical protein
MTQDTQAPADSTTSEDAAARTSIFFAKLDKDIWEAWTWAAVGLASTAAIIWIVAYMKLGYYSVYAYGVGIPLTSLFAVPIILWGLIKTMINPPIMRMSRSVGFVALFATAWLANSPLFSAPVSTVDWVSEHSYQLPFEGDWYTYAGGPERDNNYLVTAPAMRFAYTFTRLTEEGEPFSGDEKLLENYPCYGAPVLAPAAASVVSVYNTQKDNVPGQPSQENMLGNHIVLKVDHEEYFIATFLKKGSIPVAVGDKVAAGDRIGACGNSGGSAQPHLQVYLVKDGEKLILTEGLPMPFVNYEVFGPNIKTERVVSGIPLGSGDPQDTTSGQHVRPFTP